MNCSRCGGLMIEDQLPRHGERIWEMWTRSLRCVNCGHVHDSVIEQNRLPRQEKVLALPVVSRTIRMTKSILEQSPSSDERSDVTWPCDPSMPTRHTGRKRERTPVGESWPPF